MSKLSMRSEMRDFIIKLDNLIREGVIEPSFEFVLDGSDLIPWSESSKKVAEVFRQGEDELKVHKFNWLRDRGYVNIEHSGGSTWMFEIEQTLHDLVDRDFEIESPSTNVSINTQYATVNITRADAVNLINNNVQLADALEDRLRAIISEEHAFIFDAINELRAAVDNAGKENAIKLFFNRIAMIVDVYTLAQIMGVIAR